MRIFCTAFAAAWWWFGGALVATAGATQPNIIYILVDDLGYGDLGCFHQDAKSGNKFDTPAIDGMAAEGMKLTQHYIAAPVCAPSRASSRSRTRFRVDLYLRSGDFSKRLSTTDVNNSGRSGLSVSRGSGSLSMMAESVCTAVSR